MLRRSKTDDWSSLVIAGLARHCTAVPPPGTAEIVQTDRTVPHWSRTYSLSSRHYGI